MTCVICNTESEGDFCPTCGEKKGLPRITLASISSTLFTSFLQMDKGFLYNVKNLTIQPQKAVLSYIQGKRRYVFNPVSYAVLCVSFYLLVSSFFSEEIITTFGENKVKNAKGMTKASFEAGKFLGRYVKYFWLLNIFYLSFFTRLFFKKYNYFEHVAINSFILGHATLLGVITHLLFKSLILIFNPFVIVALIYLLYAVHKTKKDKYEILSLSFISVLFSYIVFVAIPMLIKIFILK